MTEPRMKTTGMTVQLLIAELQKLPPHLPVCCECPETEGGWSIDKVQRFTVEHLSNTEAVMLKIGRLVY